MYRYARLHSLLQCRYAGLMQYLQNHHQYCTEARPETSKRLYDLTTYQFHYTEEEEYTILEILNQSSEQDLVHLGITKGAAKRLLKGRERKGNFNNVSQLLDIDGFGLKLVENVCKKALKDLESSSSEDEQQRSSLTFHKKRLVKPKVQQNVIDNTNTILALDLTVSTLSWTYLDRQGVVLDVGLMEVLLKGERMDAPKIYDKMVCISRKLPTADIYVWEERSNYAYLQKAPLSSIMVSLKLSQMRGMLTALLDTREDEETPGRLFYLRDLLVSKLFQLKVGEERISGINLADDLMNCETVLSWLPPLELDESVKHKYFSADKPHRKLISTSLFIGLAFHQAILENNLEAHKIIVDKE